VEYDVFISHASENKESFVEFLANEKNWTNDYSIILWVADPRQPIVRVLGCVD
jgi:hypothetical protein